MAMIKCKECKQEISNKADACPHCGAKVKKPTGCATILIGIIFFFIMVFVIGNLFYKNPVKQSSDNSQIKPIEQSKPKFTEEEEKKKMQNWMRTIIKNVDGFKDIAISGDRKELIITVSDAWYNTPKYQKERIMEQTGKQFAGFAAQMGWRGDNPNEANYPSVIFNDIAGKRVGKHSTWGTKVYE
jgi:hypothetical protein